MKQILYGSWQERLPEIKADLIFFDPPYGVTAHKWDKKFSPLDLDRLWNYLKPDGVIVMFSNDTSPLWTDSYLSTYKYKWYWKKNRNNNVFNSGSRPLSPIEELHVFSKAKTCRFFGGFTGSILEHDCVKPSKKVHPSQKPIELCKFIISKYTNEGDLVVDICSGSGTIPLAAYLTNRDFLGIEKEEEFFHDSVNRVKYKMIKE